MSAAAPADRAPSGHTSANAIFALMSRFNSSVPMDDSPRGFFGILNAFFDQLAAEEAAACEWSGITPTEYPPFGNANDDYNAVARPFYNVWSSFSTKKTFSWRDKYRLRDAPDRRIRRLMEKENKKFREEGIREFNDAVLSLVAFVKKRDPRYVPNTQSEAERQQFLKNSAAAQAARSRAANREKMADYVMPEWAQSRDDDEHNYEFSMSEEEQEVEEIECVVCNKTFKSEKQFETHEKSKKHLKAVQQLRRQMKKEDASLDLQDAGPAIPTSPPDVGLESEGEAESGALEEGPDTAVQRNDADGEEEGIRSPTKEDNVGSDTSSLSGVYDDEYAPRSTVEERIMHSTGSRTHQAVAQDEMADAVDSAAAALGDVALDDRKNQGKKVGKAKLKREKRAARQAAEAQASQSVSFVHTSQMYTHTRPFRNPISDALGVQHKCAVCSQVFESRNKLFAHCRDLDHAVPVASAKAGRKKRR